MKKPEIKKTTYELKCDKCGKLLGYVAIPDVAPQAYIEAELRGSFCGGGCKQ